LLRVTPSTRVGSNEVDMCPGILEPRRAAIVFALIALCGGCTHPVTPFVEDPTVLELRHPAAGEAPLGNFAGRIPCETCDKIKIVLSLFQKAADPSQKRYQLERVGEDGNARITTRGQWTRSIGRPGDPAASLILLDSNTPPQFSRYLSLDNRLLLMLDDQNQLLLGNGAWSYTLSWIEIAALDALTPEPASPAKP
jgi:hypothetical protein